MCEIILENTEFNDNNIQRASTKRESETSFNAQDKIKKKGFYCDVD